jgi:phospholipid-binding lipoprotein MlaA
MLAAHFVAAGLAVTQPAALPVGGVDAVVQAQGDAIAYSLAQEEPPVPDAAAKAAPAPEKYGPPVPAETAQVAAPDAEIDPNDPLLNEYKPASDPLQGVNRISFDLSWTIDKVIIRPVAMVYRAIVPKPARDGIHNVLENFQEPMFALNDLLQLRPGRALRTLARFVINSTIGLGGIFDIAKREPFHIAYHRNSFGDTLGYYGVKPGPYIYIPILGPTTLRDMADNAQGFLWPGLAGDPLTRSNVSNATMIADGLDQRERNDDELKAMFHDAIDRYASFRENYLQDRAGEIARLKARHGETVTNPAFDDPLIDPAAEKPGSGTQAKPALDPER